MKRLSPKFINRAIVGLAMLAPIVYLFGSLFCGLIGSHGTVVFADGDSYAYQTTTEPIEADTDCRFLWNDTLSWPSYTFSDWSMTTNGIVCDRVRWSATGFEIRPSSSQSFVFVYKSDTGWIDEGYKTFVFKGSSWNAIGSTSKYAFLNNGDLQSLQLDTTPMSNSEYVFEQFFDGENWLKSMGEETLVANPRGFAPFAYLIDYLDDNMLHLSTSQVGLMGYGYLYWCAHVLLFDLLFYISVFFIRLIKSILNKFERTDY